MRPVRSIAAVVGRRMPDEYRGRERFLTACDVRLSGRHPIVTAPMRLGYKMRVDLRSRTEVFAYYTGRYDTDLIAAALRCLPPGGVALDVGANVGFWSVPLAQRGIVHAFEPVPANAARLRENAALNHVTEQMHVHQLGLSDRAGNATITLREDFQRGATTGNAAIVIDDTDDRFDQITVELDTLDALSDRIGITDPALIKVDVEGHEDLFLHGARRTLARCRPSIWIEWNRFYYDQRGIDPTAAIADALRGLDYTYLRRERRRWIRAAGFASPHDIDDLVIVPSERASVLSAAC